MSISNKRKWMYCALYLSGVGIFLITYWVNNAVLSDHYTFKQNVQMLFETNSGYFANSMFGVIFSNMFVGLIMINNQLSYVHCYRMSRVSRYKQFQRTLTTDSLIFSALYIVVGVFLAQIALGTMIANFSFWILIFETIISTGLFLSIIGEFYRLMTVNRPYYLGMGIVIVTNALISLIFPRLHLWDPLLEINHFTLFFENQLTIMDIVVSVARLSLILILMRMLVKLRIKFEDIL
ncbi:hypothetical protein FCF16_02225 [Lentilactobacillus buchneri]|uniref:Uncharacterized protein n=1 Tax=Lentilactobacillus buchneri subsp. silagei CD034 TaxID=1071400 RepID=J9W967_LENBU|nr:MULTISPECIES: hypothetical protein [Lentilactobacillus]AFS01350.1 hypothetical protein LBUCD034_2383 [Lentilactobacillus buchneri subsp. silagei CD034]MCC6102040.1 hypothetical protein [Lactobacillus sp.]MCT2901077.1 hypothetical protein [Lentilactobacillus buchneri]MCT3542689.1 hypothetical protein [Lentilactobacillus buchneri]MCT3545830.1 hypothetical protein [Lentilactobacillus buchneri]